MNRKDFLKINGGAAAGIFVGGLIKPEWPATSNGSDFLPVNEKLPELIFLDADPPIDTVSVRYFIDNIQVSELTDLYAQQTNTKPIWRTIVDAGWFDPGEHKLKVEADTPQGTITIKESRIVIPAKENAKRSSVSLTGAWKFANATDLPAGVAEGSSPQAVQSSFDIKKWKTILVPQSLGAVDNKWNQYDGILGVYRRSVRLEAPAKGEQISIVLQSCYWSGRVFINGTEVGQTKGGYLPSRFDITNEVRNGNNEIAIITDNRLSEMGVFKRLNAFYWNWGGLLQEVSIERNAEVSVIDMRVTGSQSGKLQLWFTTINKTTFAKKKNISVQVYDPSGKKILENRSIGITMPVGDGILAPAELKINNPLLWNLDEPNLYTIIATADGVTLKERTGFRDVKVSGADLYINDKIIENLQGFDRHADYPGLGRTQPSKLPYQELKELYDKGFRIFRPGHYPTTPAQLDAADELGMLVIEEINVTGLKGAQLATKEVRDFGAQQLTKLIHRDRSHPCIIAWSVGNENLTDEDGAEIYVKEIIELGRSLDNTRLFTHVTMRSTRDKTFQYQDIVAQNYYAGWYAPDINAIVDLLNSTQEYAGNKPIILSEYGAEAVIGREGTGKGTEFYQGHVVDSHNRLLHNRKHFIGKMYWSSTEFWCRPNWTGGNPVPITPFHVKALQGYHRQHNKLGWRVMFSPVRLSFASDAISKTLLGGELKISSGENDAVTIDITVQEISGKKVKGVVEVLLPDGFKADKIRQPFELEPNGSTTINIGFKGQMQSSFTSANGYIRAVIDRDTEAQPLLLTLLKT